MKYYLVGCLVGCTPLVHMYVVQAVRLYNQLRREGGQYTQLLQQCVADDLGTRRVNIWVVALYQVLSLRESRLLFPGGTRSRVPNSLDPTDLDSVRKALVDTYTAYVAALHPSPRARAHGHFAKWGSMPWAPCPYTCGSPSH